MLQCRSKATLPSPAAHRYISPENKVLGTIYPSIKRLCRYVTVIVIFYATHTIFQQERNNHMLEYYYQHIYRNESNLTNGYERSILMIVLDPIKIEHRDKTLINSHLIIIMIGNPNHTISNQSRAHNGGNSFIRTCNQRDVFRNYNSTIIHHKLADRYIDSYTMRHTQLMLYIITIFYHLPASLTFVSSSLLAEPSTLRSIIEHLHHILIIRTQHMFYSIPYIPIFTNIHSSSYQYYSFVHPINQTYNADDNHHDNNDNDSPYSRNINISSIHEARLVSNHTDNDIYNVSKTEGGLEYELNTLLKQQKERQQMVLEDIDTDIYR